MKTIPTFYDGYNCRSRLEARWIVFFKSMEIEFLYEPEGFVLDDGTCYLPDFYLPKIKFWAEVKPSEFTIPERAKADSVARQTKRQFLLLVGAPDFRDYTGLTWDAGEVTECNYWLDIHYFDRAYYDDEHRLYSCSPGDFTEQKASPRYRKAVYAARSARFDKGEEA